MKEQRAKTASQRAGSQRGGALRRRDSQGLPPPGGKDDA